MNRSKKQHIFMPFIEIQNSLIRKYFKYFVLAVLVTIPLFWKLDVLPIRVFDEARMAINAQEMVQNGNYLVPHFGNNPDMWNTKPPLLVWFQAAFMKTIGVNEWAVRLPSAIAALLTCLALLTFSILYLKRFWFGFIAVIILITTQGYVNFHATRTGDYDSLLTLFTTVALLLFFVYTETKKSRFLYLFFLSIALAVLTKGIAGLLFLPALLIYLLWKQQVFSTLKNNHFYFGIIGFLMLVLGYYALREAYNSGYLIAVWENELGGRYLSAIEQHHQDSWFYYDRLTTFLLKPWVTWIPIGLILGLLSWDVRIKRLAVFSSLSAVTYLLIISSAKTKLEWYVVPTYPFFALLSAIVLHYIFNWFKTSEVVNNILKFNFTPYLFFALVAFTPYRWTVKRTMNPKEHKTKVEFYAMGYYMQDALNGKHNLNGFLLVEKGYNAHNQFYLNELLRQGVDFTNKNRRELATGDRIVVYQEDVKQYVSENYFFEKISEPGYIAFYQILGKR